MYLSSVPWNTEWHILKSLSNSGFGLGEIYPFKWYGL